MSRHTVVSVVIPMLDEADRIIECLDAFAGQTYPVELLDLIVVDGGSTDGSSEMVDAYGRDHPWVRRIDNPERKAAAAFNRGSRAARGEVICIFSAHGVPDRTYVESSLDALGRHGADGVGGRYRHEGDDPVAAGIGLAMASPMGMGSVHRFASEPGEVDTISHPAYRAESLLAVLPFDERLERNADYELNWRMREQGMRLWFDPSISSVYRPRGSLRSLGRQFWWYGRWKERMVRRHPRSLRPRQAVAPAAVTGLLLSPALLRWRRTRWLVPTALAAYVGVLALGVRSVRPSRHGADPLTTFAAYPVMHGAWGLGFVVSFFQDLVKEPPRG